MSTIMDMLEKVGTLIDCKSGKEGTLKDFQYKYLGLYFTATWCSYCVKIVNKLPLLVEKINQNGEFLKLITLRLDEDPSNFAFSYLRYKTISYEDTSDIAIQLGARNIPSIYVFDILGRLVTRKGLEDIMRHQGNTIEYWDSKVKEYDHKENK